jgi:glycosyltransferase involved in cell wall biosynthesis
MENKINLNLAIFGRGGAVIRRNGYGFQAMDIELVNDLSKKFSKIFYMPPTLKKIDPHWKYFANIYSSELKKKNVSIIPLFTYRSFSIKKLWLKKLNAYLCWHKNLFKGINKSDICLCYMPSPMTIIGFCIAKFLKKPIIAYIGGDLAKYELIIKQGSYAKKVFLFFKYIMQQIVLKKSNKILCRNQEILKKSKNETDKTFYIKGNTRLSIEDMYFRKDTCKKLPIRILVVSSLIPLKGVDDIIVALSILKTSGYNVFLTHAGAFYQENLVSYKRLVVKLGIEKYIEFKGFIQNFYELLQLYRQSDIFIIASHSEGFPRAITEAQSQGLPVITTAVGGIPKVLKNGKDAILIEPGKPYQLAEAVESIIRKPYLRRRIISNGYLNSRAELFGKSPADQIADLSVNIISTSS